MIGSPFVNARCDGRDAERSNEQCRASVVFGVPLNIDTALLPALLVNTHEGWARRQGEIFCPRCTNLILKAVAAKTAATGGASA